MESIHDRRNDSRARLELALPVELGHSGFDEAFEADVVDLSPGGLAVRSPCLPDLGSRLHCRFESMSEGPVVSVLGEVVWAHVTGERGGEFGLRFVELDAETEAVIGEMLAERAYKARSLGPCREGTLVKLQVEGAGGAIQARVAQTDDELTTYEQELDLLALGRAVLASQTYGHGRRGKIAHVDLRFEGATPMLAVTVSFAQGQTEYGEFRVTETAQAAVDASDTASDTAPDLEAPVRALATMDGTSAGEPSRFSYTTVTEFDASRATQGAPQVSRESAVESRAELSSAELDRHADVRIASSDSARDEVDLPAALRADTSAQACEAASDAHAASVESPSHEPRRAEQLDLLAASVAPRRAAKVLDDDPIRHEFQPGLSPWLLRIAALRARLLEFTELAARRAAAFMRLTQRVLGPRVLLALVKTRGALAKLWRHQLAPFLGALRRLVAARFAPPRRTTAAPRTAVRVQGQSRGNSRVRTVGLLAMCAAALGLCTYAVWPAPTADVIVPHRPVQAPVEAAIEPEAAAAPAVPAPAVVPASSPYAATAAERAANVPAAPSPAPAAAPASPKPAIVRGTSFGASDVPDARRFVLRMSAPIKRIEGIPDVGGFTVVIPGSLSLDRAGTISASLSSVSRAMILNKGDRAELTIRFAPGKSPRYRVQAQGQAIEVLIGG